jgi:hypothetical protein
MDNYILIIFEGGLFWIAYCLFKWCADTIRDHYKDSIFSKCEYFRHDWTRKYVDGDPAKGRKKILGIPIPSMFFDGWHLFDVLRNTAAFSAMYHMACRGYWSIEVYLFYGAIYALVLVLTDKIFYEGLLIKKH